MTKNMKRIYLLFSLITAVATLSAQPLFVPDKDITKVGEVLFQSPKSFTLGFSNKGDKPLVVKEVRPSCGCIDVAFDNKPIEPGAHGEIRLTFDAKMLGTFYKDVEILTNAQDQPLYMAIQGIVVKEVQDFSGDYPIDLGNVRLLSNYIEYDDVNKGDMPVQEIRVANVERTPYKPELMHLPPYLSAEYVPETIPGGKTGIIRLTLDSKKLFQLGLNQTSIYLARYMGDKVNEDNEIVVSAVQLPDFSQLSQAQRDQAPVIQLSEEQLDFGSMEGRKKAQKKLTITNTGKTTLHIRQVQVFNKSLSVSLGDRTLEPGKSTRLKVTVNTKYLKKAKARPRVLLISDDPENAKKIINIHVTP